MRPWPKKRVGAFVRCESPPILHVGFAAALVLPHWYRGPSISCLPRRQDRAVVAPPPLLARLLTESFFTTWEDMGYIVWFSLLWCCCIGEACSSAQDYSGLKVSALYCFGDCLLGALFCGWILPCRSVSFLSIVTFPFQSMLGVWSGECAMVVIPYYLSVYCSSELMFFCSCVGCRPPVLELWSPCFIYFQMQGEGLIGTMLDPDVFWWSLRVVYDWMYCWFHSLYIMVGVEGSMYSLCRKRHGIVQALSAVIAILL
jgi:hypothetical protein